MNFTTQEYMFIAWLHGVGSVRFWQLVENYPSFSALIADESLIQRLAPQARQSVSEFCQHGYQSALFQSIERELHTADSLSVKVLTPNHPDFPKLLKEAGYAPPALYVAGDSTVLDFPQVAMVGSRNASAGGKRLAAMFAEDLAKSGFVVTSGLALGIDTAAHQGALNAQGKTVAVVGTGMDRVYPKSNRNLWRDIVDDGGAVVSEFPFGTPVLAANFPKRNRTISGLACGTLVVEAALRSGSLITARFAAEQGREIFAVPGSIHNPLSRGCHALIKEGAKLVETSDDIVAELKGILGFNWSHIGSSTGAVASSDGVEGLSTEDKKLIDRVGYDGLTVDQLADVSGVSIGDLLARLVDLEIRGYIAQEGERWVCIRSSVTMREESANTLI